MFASSDLGRGSREEAYQAMTLKTWPAILEGRDAGVTGTPVEHRHPLLDLRLIEFGLSLPAIPWCVDKYLLREASKGVLPEAVRLRPKRPLGGDPMPFVIRNYWEKMRQPLAPHPALARYIDVQRLPHIIDETKTEGYWLALRVFVLNFWLLKHQR
jgi:asparagine synthase (glutamine-hydrolysing)